MVENMRKKKNWLGSRDFSSGLTNIRNRVCYVFITPLCICDIIKEANGFRLELFDPKNKQSILIINNFA